MELRHIKISSIIHLEKSYKNLDPNADCRKDTTLIAKQIGKKYILTSGFARFENLKKAKKSIIPVLIEKGENDG
jgi:hypothetical protein